jgi:microcystin-dependent protein
VKKFLLFILCFILQAQARIPIGAVLPYAGCNAGCPGGVTQETLPGGWLFANGQAVSRATYKALFQAIGTTYGTGDGSTTFNVPDCNGRVLAGRDNQGGLVRSRLTSPLDGSVLGASGGAQTNTPTFSLSNHAVQFPAHYHNASPVTVAAGGTHGHTLTNVGDYSAGAITYLSANSYTLGYVSNLLINSGGSHTHNFSGYAGVYGASGAENGDAAFPSPAAALSHSITQDTLSTLAPTLITNCIVKY